MRHLTGVWARATAGNPMAAVLPATAAALKSPRRDVALGAPALAPVVMRVSVARVRAEVGTVRTGDDARIIGFDATACQGTRRGIRN